MHPKNMAERIIFLKRTLTENEFGERLEIYAETGKGWASIKFKSAPSSNDQKNTNVIYQATMHRPIPKFHRLLWRNQEYALVSGPIIDGSYHLISFLIQAVKTDSLK